MKLGEYLNHARLDRHQFAERIGVSSETIRRYLTGERRPDRQKLVKIAEATEGQVTANDFFGIAA
jgi:transcriptional regulator with XRE-family HTH domain